MCLIFSFSLDLEQKITQADARIGIEVSYIAVDMIIFVGLQQEREIVAKGQFALQPQKAPIDELAFGIDYSPRLQQAVAIVDDFVTDDCPTAKVKRIFFKILLFPYLDEVSGLYRKDVVRNVEAALILGDCSKDAQLGIPVPIQVVVVRSHDTKSVLGVAPAQSNGGSIVAVLRKSQGCRMNIAKMIVVIFIR